MLDIVIKNGLIVDGTGAPGQRGDIGILDGRIVEIGTITDEARKVIDADGMVVAPGLIDLHTHYDPHVLWDPYVTPSSLHGVTTVIGGNCGFTLAPIDESAAKYLIPMLARVEGMPLDSLELAVDVQWSSFGEFLSHLDNRLAINVGFLVGHSTVRRLVMAEDATKREATDDEIAQMEALVDRSLSEGALGFSSSWGSTHYDHLGDPVPSRWGSAEELFALCRRVKEHPGTTVEFIPPRADSFDESTYELLTAMSLESDRPVNWNLLRARSDETSIASMNAKLGASDHAGAAGARVVPLTLPEPFRMRVNFSSGFLYDSLPGWMPVMSLPLPDRLRAFADPTVRANLKAAVDPSHAVWTDWPALRIENVVDPRLSELVGQTVGEVARSRGVEPFDALLDVVIADGGLTVFEAPVMDDDDASWKLRAELVRDPRVVIGGSDAGAHLDMVMTFACHTRFLAEMVRKRELLTLEEAIRLITDVPAQFYGLRDRGRLVEGYFADVVVFDLSEVGPGVVELRFDLPGGGARLYSESTGIAHVIINGVNVVEAGAHTGALGGAVLRSGKDTATVNAR